MQAVSSGIRKAAILVASLEQAAAESLLAQMGPTRARQVREAVGALGAIDPEEQQRVIQEFFRGRPAPRRKDDSGVELNLSHMRPRATSAIEPRRELRASPSTSNTRPFSFLEEAEVDKLARVLTSERPQTIALVLSHLSPEQSGQVLVRLQPAQQIDVIRRLVDLEETEPEILREVEQALEVRFAEQLKMQRRRVAGVSALAGILEVSDGAVATQLIKTLKSYDPALAERLSPPPVHFDDFWQFDEASLAIVMRAAEPDVMLLALVGAPPELVDRFLRRLPATEANRVRRELDYPGPLRLRDVEEARREVGELARQLAVQGRIRLPGDLTARSHAA
ncbi:MAG: FliG C-terminal domain-containing protein [Planctomycetota bacterium]